MKGFFSLFFFALFWIKVAVLEGHLLKTKTQERWKHQTHYSWMTTKFLASEYTTVRSLIHYLKPTVWFESRNILRITIRYVTWKVRIRNGDEKSENFYRDAPTTVLHCCIAERLLNTARWAKVSSDLNTQHNTILHSPAFSFYVTFNGSLKLFQSYH